MMNGGKMCGPGRRRLGEDSAANDEGSIRSDHAARIGSGRDEIDALYRRDSRRVLAALLRLLGDFDLAEEALHEAFAAAVERWPRDGLPDRPLAWLVSVGRFSAIDGLRRRARFDSSMAKLAVELESRFADSAAICDPAIEDDRLRLVFMCCHPVLGMEDRVALTLREVCGLKTAEIARAFLVTTPAMAQRLARAKASLRETRPDFELPGLAELEPRLEAVLAVIYLVFNEGYTASSGEGLTRPDLSAEAIRLGRLIVELRPDHETMGLLALMLLGDSRRRAREDAEGHLLTLAEQDRGLWDRGQIAEGLVLVRRLEAAGASGPYAVQASIAAVHAAAPSLEATDWASIVRLYDRLLLVHASPVVELNRAVAISMRDGAGAGLALVDAILARGELEDYRYAHATRADLCRRLGKRKEAAESYAIALALTNQESERRFLEKRISELAR